MWLTEIFLKCSDHPTTTTSTTATISRVQKCSHFNLGCSLKIVHWRHLLYVFYAAMFFKAITCLFFTVNAPLQSLS